MSVALIVVLVVILLAIVVTVLKAVVVIPQASAAVVERLGRYRTTFTPGLNFLVPFIDWIRDRIDLREQVVSFPPQPVITKDNLTVHRHRRVLPGDRPEGCGLRDLRLHRRRWQLPHDAA